MAASLASCSARLSAGAFTWSPRRAAAGPAGERFSEVVRWGNGRRGAERGRLQVVGIGWDPEGILGAPQPGHIARRKFQKSLDQDQAAKEEFEREKQKERERIRAAREARVVPATTAGLVDYLLDTEARELEFEIARCRPRLDAEFFKYLKNEIGSLRFAVNPSQQADDRLVELEALEKVLQEGIEAYDKLSSNLLSAKDRLAKILVSQDKRATLLEMAGENQLDRPLLTLLDQNIAAARSAGQEQAVGFMEKIRGAVLKYMTV